MLLVYKLLEWSLNFDLWSVPYFPLTHIPYVVQTRGRGRDAAVHAQNRTTCRISLIDDIATMEWILSAEKHLLSSSFLVLRSPENIWLMHFYALFLLVNYMQISILLSTSLVVIFDLAKFKQDKGTNDLLTRQASGMYVNTSLNMWNSLFDSSWTLCSLVFSLCSLNFNLWPWASRL